jgi:hypothetical protein
MFKPYFSDWLARFYLSGVWLLVLVAGAFIYFVVAPIICGVTAGCGSASW